MAERGDGLRIGFLTKEHPLLPVSGGLGASIRNLSHELARRGNEVTIMGWGKRLNCYDKGVKIEFFEQVNLPKIEWLINGKIAEGKINRMVKEAGLDIVEAPDWHGMSAGMRLDCPLVVRCHGSAACTAHILGEHPRFFVRVMEKLALKQADSIFAVSKFTAETTKKIFQLKKNIGVLHNGIDISEFKPAKTKQTMPSNILYFGSIARKKGTLDLAAIFSKVAEENPEARLVLAGRDTPDKKTGCASTLDLFKKQLSEKARRRVEYKGLVPFDEIKGIIGKATVCVFPSHAEALPMSWLEAMACAKPIIAYEGGWAGEIIDNNYDGKLVQMGNTKAFAEEIISLLNDEKERNKTGKAARKKIEQKFSTKITAKQTLKEYKKIIEGKKNG